MFDQKLTQIEKSISTHTHTCGEILNPCPLCKQIQTSKLGQRLVKFAIIIRAVDPRNAKHGNSITKAVAAVNIYR